MVAVMDGVCHSIISPLVVAAFSGMLAAPRMRRVSRNEDSDINLASAIVAAPRMRRVSRNSIVDNIQDEIDAAPRMRRVSRNFSYGPMKKDCGAPRLA